MEILQDGCIAFFCAIGIAAVLWWVASAIFYAPSAQIPNLRIVLSLAGEAPAMGHDVRALWRLRRQTPTTTIVLEDVGLAPHARDLAQSYCLQADNMVLTPPLQPEKEVIHGDTLHL